MALVHVGLSGYSYKPWQGEGRFYPAELKQAQFLEYYCDHYPAVEMDGSWYRMPAEKSVEDWIKRSPESFKFSFKMHRDVTHMRRLKPECKDSLEFFLKRLVPMAKAGKLGPILVQLPPNMKRDDERLKGCFAFLPHDLSRIEGGSADLKVTWAIEFRNDTWNDPAVEGLLRENNVGWVAAETDDVEAQKRDTGPQMYSRLRKSDYKAEELSKWAAYFASVAEGGKDVFVYCKHEDEGSPWIWADQLLRELGERGAKPLGSVIA